MTGFNPSFELHAKSLDNTATEASQLLHPLYMSAQEAIFTKYEELGGPSGFLGAAAGELQGAFFQEYANGAIYWSRTSGAFEVHGAILDKYRSLGGSSGFLGFPTTDETGTPDQRGRYNQFQNGSIYWTEQTGAFEVHGAIRDKWISLGWERSYLGYPISDEHDGLATFEGVLKLAGRVSDFENGSIAWSPQFGVQDSPQVVSENLPNITFGTGLPVGGNAVLVYSSDGMATFKGHLHDSGFPSFDYSLVLVRKGTDSVAYACTQAGHLHGTDESGSRDDDWDQTSFNQQIVDNWPAIRGGTGGHSISITSDFTPKAIFDEIVSAVGLVSAVVGIIALAAAGGSSSQTVPGEQSANQTGT